MGGEGEVEEGGGVDIVAVWMWVDEIENDRREKVQPFRDQGWFCMGIVDWKLLPELIHYPNHRFRVVPLISDPVARIP